MKKLFKTILTILMAIGLGLGLSSSVWAQDATVTCDETDCDLDPNQAIFSETNIYPSWSQTKVIKAVNNAVDPQTFAVSLDEFDDFDPESECPLGNYLNISIKESGETDILYEDNLTNFNNLGYKTLSLVDSEQDYDFTLFLPEWVGNNCQAKDLSFDLILGFETVPAPTPTATPTPTPSDGTTDGTTTTDDGDDGGCTAEAPSEAPDLSATAGVNTVTLTWTAVSPVTHYGIQYGTTSGDYVYGALNVGNVTSYVVSGLSAGTTYYFQVVPFNDCMGGPGSNEDSATPTGTVLGTTTQEGVPAPATGFTEEILGESTPSTKKQTGKIEGVQTAECQEEPSLWWLILVLQLVLSIAFGWWAKRDDKQSLWPIILGLAVLSQLAHWFLLPCNCADHWLCQQFWLLNLAVTAVSLFYLFVKQQE